MIQTDGQHSQLSREHQKTWLFVNKVETAVRAIHIPTGMSVTASTARSQLMNKKEATERLKNKLFFLQLEAANQNVQAQWMEHNSLERGNAVKVFKDNL
jgi:peptide chain release factor